ncbi:MAG: hypothetical protein ACLFQR_10160 [Desulfovibrionales bacterium]
MHIISELIHDMASSTMEGIIGVSGIFIFLAIIVASALYRINEIKKSDHH